MFVGHKTHSQIFSLVAGTPLIAIAYHKKTRDFMTQFGIEKYYISEEQISGTKLIEMFDELNSNLDTVNQKEEETGSTICTEVRQDFAKMIDDIRVYLKSIN
jgi:polysaccharide pyruvyl transferase WcaK-like protein